jgi:hypothetical protein
MKRIKKQKPKPHVVIPDTSAIWHDDKRFCADPEFDAFWTKYAAPFYFQLVIPEVVEGELLFQHTTSALKSLRRANQAISDVERVTQRRYSHRVTEQRIKHEVERKFRHWEKKHQAKIITTPTNSIQWPEIIRKAVWREAPFSFDSQNSDNEKGFRDCLILETIIDFCAQDQRDISIAFLCKDVLLRETAETILTKDKRFSAYETIPDFKTYIDLTKEKLEDAFIKALVRRASNKFFTRGDSSCLYIRDNIKDTLQNKYRNYFDNPEDSERPGLATLLTQGLRKWEPVDSGTFWISRSQFLKTTPDGHYLWSNAVTYVRQYSSTESPSLLGTLAGQKQFRLLILSFVVTWNARVIADGRFREYAFISEELQSNQFREPSIEEIKRYNIEVKS